MTGRFRNLARPLPIIRLAILPLLALAALLVTSDGAHATCKCFVPNPTSTYSTTEPGTNPDIAGTFDIGLGPDGQYGAGQPGSDDTGDYNFGGVVGLSPSSPADAEVTDGAILGSLTSQATLAILNNPCTSGVQVPFTFMEGTTDINNVVHMLEFGVGNELGPMAGDNPPFEGVQATKPPPVVTQYPAFLNAIFDPDWVDFGADKIPGNGDDNNGSQPPIKPRFRAVAATWVGFASLWVVLQQVIFEPGTKLPQLPALGPAYGYPSVTVLQTSSAAGSATPPLAGPITDFCSPLKVNTSLPGVTGDNQDTGPSEGGVPLRTLPAAGYQIFTYGYYLSQRDADSDGFENGLDPCPLNADTTWDPRATQPQPGDDDVFAGQPSGDGLPDDTCDPDKGSTAIPAAGDQPTDYDGDGYPSRGDNCPLIANGKAEADTPAGNQKDTDKNAAGEEVGDGIGDACDPDPGTPNGEEILCVRETKVVVGGDPVGSVSPCGPLPAIADDDGDGVRNENDTCPNTPSGATVDIYGCSQTQEATVELGSITTNTAANTTDTTAGGGVGGPASGIGSLSPVAGTVPAWAAIAAGLGAAGLIGSLGTLASRVVKRRRDL